MENGIVLDKKESFLERIKDERLREVIGARVKELESREKEKSRSKDLASITRELLESEYVDLEGTVLTVGDMMVATATANLIKNPRTTFKEINDAQKVIEGVTKDNSGVQIVFNTLQDMGE